MSLRVSCAVVWKWSVLYALSLRCIALRISSVIHGCVVLVVRTERVGTCLCRRSSSVCWKSCAASSGIDVGMKLKSVVVSSFCTVVQLVRANW